MELYQLRYFESVARHQSMARASEELHVTQPALSKAIKKLEADLGVELFDRVGRRIFLNDKGLYFRDSANQLLVHADQSAKSLREFDAAREGTVRIAIRGPQHAAIACTDEFMKLHPDVSFLIDAQDSFDKNSTVWDSDIVFCQVGKPFDPGVGVPYMKREFGLLVPHDHWLTSDVPLDMKALKDERFVFLTRPYEYYEMSYQICLDEGGFSPNVRCETDSRHALFRFVSDGLGIGFVDGTGGELWEVKGTRFLPLERGFGEGALCIACRRPYRLATAAAAFVDFAFDYFDIPKEKMDQAVYDWV